LRNLRNSRVLTELDQHELVVGNQLLEVIDGRHQDALLNFDLRLGGSGHVGRRQEKCTDQELHRGHFVVVSIDYN